MTNIFIIAIMLVSVVLVLFVLVQNPKGGGLNSEFGSAVQLGGVKRATDFLEKGTWGLAIALVLLVLVLAPNYSNTESNSTNEDGEMETSTENFQSADEQPSEPTANPFGGLNNQ